MIVAETQIETGARSTIESPCVGLCTLDAAGKWCIGCGRTLGDIAAWSGLSADERWHVVVAARDRLASRGRFESTVEAGPKRGEDDA